MSTGTGADEQPAVDRPNSLRELLRRSLITGTAVIIPVVVTLFVLTFALDFISSALQPIVAAIRQAPVESGRSDAVLKLIAVAVFLTAVFLLGFVAEFSKRGTKAGEQFDELMAAIPGIGSVYTSFDEMSEIILDSDTDSFQEVKLVEYPGEGSYTIAFKTADTPSVIEQATDHEGMVTLFMPMAPNPVMGGFVIHVARDRVVDVDLTVEQGIRSIVTSGVAIGGEGGPAYRGLSPDEMETIGEVEAATGGERPIGERWSDEYDESVAPEHSETPGKIAERERNGDRDATQTTPAEASGRPSDQRDATASTPAEASGRTPDERVNDDGD